jgi:DNA primase large subunit
VAESKTASDYLKNSQDRTSNYFELLASSLKIKITPANASDVQGRKGVFLIPFSSYLLYTPRDIHFKLSNMELDNGNVKVTQHQAERILEEAIRKRLDESALPRMHEPSQQIKNAIMRLSAFLPKEKIEPSKIEKKDFPPCILKLIEHLNSSINVPHSGRLALAIYLIKAGLTDEQIDSVFSGAPDYNKETTIYQIQYIRKKAYSVPSCKTMDTYGICIALCRCNNPANYREALHSKFAALPMQAQKEAETNG